MMTEPLTDNELAILRQQIEVLGTGANPYSAGRLLATIDADREKIARKTERINMLVTRLASAEAVVQAANGLADHCKRSLNAGPISKDPSREARHWRALRDALTNHGRDTV